MSEIVWRPDPETVERSVLGRFMSGHGFGSYEELYARSVEDVEWFWDATVRHLGIEWYELYDRVLENPEEPRFPRWFPGGSLNLAHNALDRHAAGPLADRTALVYESEEGEVQTFTFRELKREVDRCAYALRSLGVERGDRVGIFMPMIPETVFAALAAPEIGAVYIPIFSGYSAGAVATRLADCDAKVLLTADGSFRRGNLIPMKETADAALENAPGVRRTLVARRTGLDVPWNDDRDVWWDEATSGAPEEVPTEAMDPDDPVMIIYTSGTTGRPKGCVHTHSGLLLKPAGDLAYCFDVGPESVFYWITDMGWLMGPLVITGTLALGGTLVIFDGAPDHPDPGRTWELAAKHGVTHLGLSPTFTRAIMSAGDEPVEGHDLSALRCFGSTGEPWNPRPWRWLFNVVGESRRPIMNYAGGTEICGGILGCNFLQPQKPCAFGGPIPGMAADVVDGSGNPVRGEVGELAIRKPWPGMTQGFWRDRERYLETYWSSIPDLWVHGDWALVDEDGLWYIQGRSDDTINVAGKRVGPAEVESVLVSHPEVVEAAVIGVPHEVKGEAVIAFVIPGGETGEKLREELRSSVADELGRSMRPESVFFVEDLPRTRNQKIMRRVVKAAYQGEDPGDTSSLENPQAIDAVGAGR